MRRWVHTDCAAVAQTPSLATARTLALCALGLSLVLGLVLESASPAEAACTPTAVDATSPAPGSTVTCSGTTTNQNGTDGYGTGDQTGITINVDALATVDATGLYGITIGDGTVVNRGAITAASSAIHTNTAANVTNFGSIFAVLQYGIFANTNATVTNNAGGTIFGGNNGIYTSTGFVDVTNSGGITGSGGNGIVAQTNATVINNAGGTIIGNNSGIVASAGFVDITNSGSITGTTGYGIYAGTNATVTNHVGGAISGILNGITADAGAATVTNSGSIAGTNTYGIFARTQATVTNNAGGTITGGSTGIYATTDATVTNNAGGSITGAQFGISANTGFAAVINSGGISGGSIAGIYAETNATVTNNASGAISGFAGIYTGAGSVLVTVNNSGSIIGTDRYGIYANDGAVSVTNLNSITGGRFGVYANNGTSTVTNSGSISGTITDGVFAYTNAAVTNDAGGTISGGMDGIYAFTGSASVTNSGSVIGTGAYGIYAGTHATVTNNAGGTISGNTGIRAGGGNSTIFNAGTIIGTGGTAIQFAGSGNTLTLAPGFAINGNVLGTGSDTLQLGGNGSGTFDVSSIGTAAQYRGFGAFNKIGTSTFALTGTSTFAGPVNVNGGTLSVNGNTTSFASLTVNAGGTLGGTGTVGNATINGGTLSPGNSIGTLTVQGNLAFTAASTYMAEVSPSNADRTNVTGTATLGGATVSANYAAGSYVTRQYTILNAVGGRIGTFNNLVNTNLPANFTPSLSYDANNAYLNLALTFVPPASAGGATSGGLTVNQANVAGALINSFNTAGGIPLVFGALTSQGLTQASGEAATGIQQATFNVMDRFINLLTDPFISGRDGSTPQGGALAYAKEGEASAYASTAKGRNASERDAYAAMARKALPRVADQFNRWSVWAAGYGGTQTTDGNAVVGSATTMSRIYGAAAGADYRFSLDTLVGFALGGAGTNYHLANGLGRGSSDVFQAGIYGRHHVGAAYLAGAFAYGWQDVTTDRTVLGIDRLRARFDANALSGRLEGGYRIAMPWMGVTPYAAGQFTTFFLPDYAEQVVAGGNIFALSYASKNVTASRSELGVRTDKSFAWNDALLTLRGRAAWAHNFDTNRSVSAIFQTLPVSGFVVNGAALAGDAALVSAGAEIKWRNGFALASTFEGEFSRNVESYAGKGVVRYQW